MIIDLRKHRPALSDLTETADLERYDAENENVIIECKARGRHYKQQLIERGKYEALHTLRGDRTALYAVYDPSGKIYLYNLTALHEAEYDFGWHMKGNLPTTSHFSNKQAIEKHVGMLHIDDAAVTIEVH